MRIDEVFGYEAIAEWTERVSQVSVPFNERAVERIGL